MVVSRPEFYSVVPDRPFQPRSGFPIASQDVTIELTHVIAPAQMPGYDEGKAVQQRPAQNGGNIHAREAVDVRLSVDETISPSGAVFDEDRDDALMHTLGQDGIL